MPLSDLLLPFLVTAIIFASVPGPAMIYAAARTLAGGRTAGLLAVLGMHLGGYVHILAASTGLALLIESTPLLLTGLRFLGAAYLAWLGITLLCRRPTRANAAEAPCPTSTRYALLESMTVQALNPAAALFYLAFLPQFVNMSGQLAIWAQFLLLGAVVNIIFTTTKVIVVMLAGKVLLWLRLPNGRHGQTQRLAGSALVGLAVHLAVGESFA